MTRLFTFRIGQFVGNKAKGRISKRVLQENKARQIFRKRAFLTPPDTHTCMCVSGGEEFSFFGKCGVLFFLVTSGLRFALLPHYRRLMQEKSCKLNLSSHVPLNQLVVPNQKLSEIMSKLFKKTLIPINSFLSIVSIIFIYHNMIWIHVNTLCQKQPFHKIMFFKYFTKFTAKLLCWSHFLIKLRALRAASL